MNTIVTIFLAFVSPLIFANTQLLKEGESLYKRFEYSKAAAKFARILKEDSKNQKARILLAKSLYRLDKIPQAYKFFKRVDFFLLNAETSYEYALSHYFMRKYEIALRAFNRVPQGHSLSDLANYYGGICALKLNRLLEAESKMESAIVLPTRLQRSRKLYRRHIVTLKYLQEKKGLEKERIRIKKKIETQIANDEKTKKPIKKADKKYSHHGFQSVSNTPTLGATYLHQVSELHGYGENASTSKSGFITLSVGPLIPFGKNKKGNQSAFGLQLKVKAEETTTEGVQKRNVQNETLEDIERIVTATKTKSTTKYGSYKIAPWFEFPLKYDFWFSFGGTFEQTMPEFKRKDQYGKISGFLLAGSKVKDKNLKLKYEFAKITNQDNKPIITAHILSGKWHFLLPYLLYSTVKLKHSYFEYPDKVRIDGAGSVSSGSVEVGRFFPMGFTLGMSGGGQFISDQLYFNFEDYDVISAEGQTIDGAVFLELDVLSFLSLEISQAIQKTVWQIEPKEAQTAFEQTEADIIHTTTAKLQLNLVF